ncbi:MAG: hypothetical protein Q9211_005280 [Gyalolechia sp. 1 TL-2023]
MSLPVRPHDIIEIIDESDDDEPVRLEDFMTAEELNNVLQGPNAGATSPDSSGLEDYRDPSLTDVLPPPTMATYDQCLRDVLDIFPDISHEHVKKLYDGRNDIEIVAPGISDAETLISLILDGGEYPRERDRLNELKRKRLSELDDDAERAAEWKNAERTAGESFYSMHARNLLQEDFLEMPRKYIDLKFKESGHLYATYLALGLAEDTYETSVPRPYVKLKKTRRPSTIDFFTQGEMSPLGQAFQKLKEELGAARAQRKKLQTQRQTQMAADNAEAMEEKRLRDSGQVMECACCFSDDILINKITFCSAHEPHSFCFECAATNANTQIGLSRYALLCMDGSGCKEPFSRQERGRFLDEKTIEKLERLQQQTELREADLANLESCPFCDFAAICPSVEIDKEFRCSNTECEQVSCRKCRNVTHIPLSCEEFKKENGVSERHQIEEARTEAVLRTCPKCKSAIYKDGGCNKIICFCGGAVCDYCGKDITKEKYMHFKDGPTSTGIPGLRGKCPTHDNDYERNQQNMDKAEKNAMEKIRKENPHLSEDDLRVKFRENVKTPPRATRPYQIPVGFPNDPLRIRRAALPELPMQPWLAGHDGNGAPINPQVPAQAGPPQPLHPLFPQDLQIFADPRAGGLPPPRRPPHAFGDLPLPVPPILPAALTHLQLRRNYAREAAHNFDQLYRLEQLAREVGVLPPMEAGDIRRMRRMPENMGPMDPTDEMGGRGREHQ